jgi:tetratricopeptide (TPR) repeat protein
LHRELGRGGFGVVYLAYDPQLRRLVALKVPRPETVVTKELRQRLLREARAAAGLEHPNLVTVYEAGEVGPVCYLASAYCPGTTLAAWLKGRHELVPWRAAAELIATLADAVQHAHCRGVVHRDLKPGNVLLQKEFTPEDIEGTRGHAGEARAADAARSELDQFTPKVADFGLAKLLLDSDEDQTRSGAILGTAAYMAPEQAIGLARLAGPPADVYALGAMLYELLAGRPPFQAESVLETLEQVRTQEPVPPSRLRPKLPRDMETVCLKCLQKDPARRYASAGDLADDLRRFLAGEPVRARPIGRTTRLWRWCRRHPGTAIPLAAMALVLVAAFAGMTWSYVRAERQRDLAVEARHEAEAEGAKAKRSAEEAGAVLGFVQDKVLAAGRPKRFGGGLGKDATIRAAVDAAEGSINKAFAKQPNVEAAIRQTLGVTYRSLGEPERAIEQLQRARAWRQAELGADHVDTLRTVCSLALACKTAGRNSESVRLLEEAKEIHLTKLGTDHVQTLACMDALADAYSHAGRGAEALALYETTLKLCRAKLGVDADETLACMHNLGIEYCNAGRLGDAVPLLEETLKGHRAKYGPDDAVTFGTMGHLAIAYREAGRLGEAIKLQTETLNAFRASLGTDHPDTLWAMDSLANTYNAGGRFSDAAALYEETLKHRRAKQGTHHPDTLIAMGNLAVAYENAGHLKESIVLQEETLKLQKAKLGNHHQQVLGTMDNLADVYFFAGRIAEAQAIYQEALRMMKAKLGPAHPYTVDTMHGLARLLVSQKDYTAAEALLGEALTAVERRGADSPVEAVRLRSLLGQCLLCDGKPRQAEAVLRAALAGAGQEDPTSWETAWTKSLLGASLLSQQEFGKAEPLCVGGYQRMMEGVARIPAPEQAKVGEALERVVKLYDAWGKKDQAEAWRKKQRVAATALPADKKP